MKTTTTILAGLIAISAAMANAQYIGLMSVRSASPVHLLPVQAAGQRLYLGGTSAHHCPSDMQTLGACPNTDDTNFEGGDGELFMGAIVPGGQQVYIDATCGAVSYTQVSLTLLRFRADHSGRADVYGARLTRCSCPTAPSSGAGAWIKGQASVPWRGRILTAAMEVSWRVTIQVLRASGRSMPRSRTSPCQATV